MAISVVGPIRPQTLVNGVPAFSVPTLPSSGLDNTMPLWILQMIPDRTGDGVPELIALRLPS